MTTDDLRTRAREAAEECLQMGEITWPADFVEGDERDCMEPYYRNADAVLALLGGPPDERNER